MAPLRFRCWNPVDKKMGTDITLGLLASLKDLSLPTLNESLQRASELLLVVMQSTGLTDKNGKEIFEGDVVKDGNGEIGKVEWDAPEFVAMGPVVDDCSSNLLTFPNTIEVIGNIYENPDLLPQAA